MQPFPRETMKKRLSNLSDVESAHLAFTLLAVFSFGMLAQAVGTLLPQLPSYDAIFTLIPSVSLLILSKIALYTINQ